MKKKVKIALLLTLFFLTNLVIGEEIKALPIREVEAEICTEIMEGKRPDLSLLFLEGEKFPIEIFIKGEFIELVQDLSEEAYVSVKKDLYLRVVGEDFLFSVNNQDWKTFEEFFKGSISCGIVFPEENSDLHLSIMAEIYQREPLSCHQEDE